MPVPLTVVCFAWAVLLAAMGWEAWAAAISGLGVLNQVLVELAASRDSAIERQRSVFQCPEPTCDEDIVTPVPHPDDPTHTANRCPTCFTTVVEA